MRHYLRTHSYRVAAAALKELAEGDESPGREAIRKFARGETVEPDLRTRLLYSRLYRREEFAAETIVAERGGADAVDTLGARIRAAFGRNGERGAEEAVRAVFAAARAAGDAPKGAGELELVLLDVVTLAYSEEPGYVRDRVHPTRGGPRRRPDETGDPTDDG